MTANAISYFKNVEAERANRAQENLKARELQELQRHNVVYEQEVARHNTEQENIARRSNDISATQVAEQGRHNRASEAISRESNDISWNRALLEYQLGQQQLDETSRHNKITEGEQRQHNRVTESETSRHNQIMEGLTESEQLRHYSMEGEKLKETTRHNKREESLKMLNGVQGFTADFLRFVPTAVPIQPGLVPLP